MTPEQARALCPGDIIVFVGRNHWAAPIRGKVLSLIKGPQNSYLKIRIEWDDEWIGTYEPNGLGQMAKEPSDDAD